MAVFQFTRPRGARRLGPCGIWFRYNVSIHAPARGATEAVRRWDIAWTFQFTRPRGARRSLRAGDCVGGSFNSRAREGRDPVRDAHPREAPAVSIHAPARGATSRKFPLRLRNWFQFTRPRGARLRRKIVRGEGGTFQFTRPRGARRAVRRRPDWWRRFNSRAREGRDSSSVGSVSRSRLFQFTRPRGARRVRHGRAPPRVVSIHAPARGATARGRPPPSRTSGFNSRAREGRDSEEPSPSRPGGFQFTRPRGARRRRGCRWP